MARNGGDRWLPATLPTRDASMVSEPVAAATSAHDDDLWSDQILLTRSAVGSGQWSRWQSEPWDPGARGDVPANQKLKMQFNKPCDRRSLLESYKDAHLRSNHPSSRKTHSLCTSADSEMEIITSPWISPLKVNPDTNLGIHVRNGGDRWLHGWASQKERQLDLRLKVLEERMDRRLRSMEDRMDSMYDELIRLIERLYHASSAQGKGDLHQTRSTRNHQGTGGKLPLAYSPVARSKSRHNTVQCQWDEGEYYVFDELSKREECPHTWDGYDDEEDDFCDENVEEGVRRNAEEKWINTEKAVAYGTVVQTTVSCGEGNENMQELFLLDGAPPSFSKRPTMGSAEVDLGEFISNARTIKESTDVALERDPSSYRAIKSEKTVWIFDPGGELGDDGEDAALVTDKKVKLAATTLHLGIENYDGKGIRGTELLGWVQVRLKNLQPGKRKERCYDASEDGDEEGMDEVELSDDEKEVEYKRSLKQIKRDAHHGNQEYGVGKKKKNFKGAGFDKSKQLQALLCSVFQVIIQKLSGREETTTIVLQDDDHIMGLILQFVACRSSIVHEDAMFAIGALTYATSVEFVKYVHDFYKYLDMGLQNFKKYLQFAIPMLQRDVKHYVTLNDVDEKITREELKLGESVDEKKNNEESKEKHVKTGISVFDLGGGLHHHLMAIVVERMLRTAAFGIGFRAEGQEQVVVVLLSQNFLNQTWPASYIKTPEIAKASCIKAPHNKLLSCLHINVLSQHIRSLDVPACCSSIPINKEEPLTLRTGPMPFDPGGWKTGTICYNSHDANELFEILTKSDRHFDMELPSIQYTEFDPSCWFSSCSPFPMRLPMMELMANPPRSPSLVCFNLEDKVDFKEGDLMQVIILRQLQCPPRAISV